MQTILSYNILEGLQQSKVQIDVFVEWVSELNPDIIFYQELNSFSEESFGALAQRCGHAFSVKIKEDGYRMGISSNNEITDIQRVTEGLRLGYIYAKIEDYHLFAVHLDPFKESERLREVGQLLAHASALPKDAEIMMVGDFNALEEIDAAAYSNPAFAIDTMAINPDFTMEFSATNAMLDAGFIDAYRIFHAEFKCSFPTYKRIVPGNHGRRIDYAFLSPALSEKCVSVEIIHDAITKYLSDHYPLVMKLK